MALAVGLGMTIDEAVSHVGLTRQTYYAHVGKHPEFFDKWKAKAELLADKTVAARITKLKANDNAEERIKALFGRAFAMTEKVIERAEQQGDAVSLETAMEIHQKITIWASKFVAQEAAKRVEVTGAVLHGHVALQDDTVAALADLHRHMRTIPSIAGAITVHAEHQSSS